MTAKKIQETALKYFSEKGYEATTLADIAQEIGIKKPSIYAHYDSKMTLFMSIVADAVADYRQCWRNALAATAGLPADERLYALFSQVAHYFIDDKIKMSFWVRLWMFAPAECRSDILGSLKHMNGEFIREIAAIFEQGISRNLLRPNPPEEMAHAYFCLLDGYLMRSICYQDFNYKESLLQLWNGFLLGIKQNSNQR